MKNGVIFIVFSMLFFSCNNQSKTLVVKKINPEISANGIEAIRINNVSDDVMYTDYTITINGLYTAKLLRKPDIVKGDGIEIPLNLFELPDGININFITFSVPGYSDYTAVIEIQLPPPNPCEITEQEATDKFGDKTGEIYKGISYYGEGTFRNSITQNGEMKILISTQIPDVIGITAFEYGKNLIPLNDGLFSYKIGEEIIENVQFKGSPLSPTGSITNEKESFLYLLKQGGIIRVQVYKNRTTYSFTVDANGFKEVYSEALEGKESTLTYYYKVPDKNNKKIEVEFTIQYAWSYDKSEKYKNSPQIEEFIKNFFRTKDVYYAYDRPGGYYQREKVEKNWAEPVLQQIKILFTDESIKYRSYDGFRAMQGY